MSPAPATARDCRAIPRPRTHGVHWGLIRSVDGFPSKRNFFANCPSTLTMRSWLSLLLVLTLVLRGLLGDAMAMGIVAPVAQTGTHAAHAARSGPPAEQLESPHGSSTTHGNAALADQQAHEAAAAHCTASEPAHCGDSAAHGANCSACGICHSAVGLPAIAALAQAPTAPQQLADGATRFASTLPASITKPPISVI